MYCIKNKKGHKEEPNSYFKKTHITKCPEGYKQNINFDDLSGEIIGESGSVVHALV